MDALLRDKKTILLFVGPAFIVYVANVLFPIALSGYYSTLDWDGIGQPTFTGLANYLSLFSRGGDSFWLSVRNSIVLAGLSVFVQVPLAMVIALRLSWGIPGESFYRTAFFVPVVLSSVVVCQLWLKIYHPSYGALNSLLSALHLESWRTAWLAETETALIAVFVPIVWQFVGYHMLLIYAAAKSVPTDITESARIDGAAFVRTSVSITIPLIKPLLRVCVIFAVVGSLKAFDHIFVLTNGGPMHATEVPSTLMYSTIFNKYMYGYGSSIAIFIIIECMVFTYLIRRLFRTENHVS